jgi:hypothetical protein
MRNHLRALRKRHRMLALAPPAEIRHHSASQNGPAWSPIKTGTKTRAGAFVDEAREEAAGRDFGELLPFVERQFGAV